MQLKNVYFINGTAYAGKSTMVKLLAEKYDGILCEENYHDRYFPEPDREEFPCLAYTRELEDWHDFIRRTPEEYEAWLDGVSKECEILELRILEDLVKEGKPVFVDTNISINTLKTVAEPGHVLIMLADPMISVSRFFERPDREKQFLYQLIMEEPDPEAAMENYRQGLIRINSKERYDRFLHSGFPVIIRDENRTVEETLGLVERAFGLKDHMNDYQYISLRERPDLKETAAKWFHEKWGVPEEAYLECMKDYLNGETECGWYLCLFDGQIIGGLVVIVNEFHDRKDLSPNICAVYTEEEYRGQGIAGKLLDLAVEDLRSKGISPVYLLTDHTGFYERYGWEFLCMAQGEGETHLSRMYIHR